MLAMTEDIIALGIDPNLVAVLQRTQSDRVTYLDDRELDQYKIRWEPDQFMPWKIEAYKQGVVAYSKTNDEQKTALFFCDHHKNIKFQIKAFVDPAYFDTKWLASMYEAMGSLKIFGVEFAREAFTFDLTDNVLTMTLPIKKFEALSFASDALGASFNIANIYGLPINYLSFNGDDLQKNLTIAFKNCL